MTQLTNAIFSMVGNNETYNAECAEVVNNSKSLYSLHV